MINRVINSLHIVLNDLEFSDRPQVPTAFTYIQEVLSATTAGFQWTPGFDGGLEQKFYVLYKKASGLLWNYVVAHTNKVTLTGLAPGTLYNVKMLASNTLGNSSETVIRNFTTKEGDGIICNICFSNVLIQVFYAIYICDQTRVDLG